MSTFPLPGANWSYLHSMRLVATTGATGYTLVNGTGTILSWTAPGDGNLHRIMLIVNGWVSVTEVGGAVALDTTLPNGQTANPGILTGGTSGPAALAGNALRIVEAGSTVSLVQSTALTSGTAVIWAELWAL